MFGRAKSIKIRVVGRTDQGKTRDHNEDNFLVADLTRKDASPPSPVREYELGERGLLLAVCDGMGGAAAGELASEMATNTIYQQLIGQWLAEPEITGQRFAFRLKEAVEAANIEIHNYAKSHPENRGMGTTATIAGVLGDHLYLAQVGDSRAYLIRGAEAIQITKDQSLMQRLVEAGELTEEEAAHSERRNIILQALGPDPKIKVDLTHQDIRRGDLLVICSDGLSGQVKKEEIAREAAGGDLIGASERLIGMANERGGPDNITVVMARFDGDGVKSVASGDEVGHQVFPLIDTEASTDPVPVYRGSKPPVPAKQAKSSKPSPPQQTRVPQRRGKRLAILAGVALAVGALGWQFVRGRSTTDAVAPDTIAAAPPDTGLLALDRLADSVTIAVRGYGDRQRQFAAHQLECPALAEGFAQVDALWVTYSVGKRRMAPLDSTRKSRDETLDASVDSINRHFDRSGCPRP
jgi:protein phosphatase